MVQRLPFSKGQEYFSRTNEEVCGMAGECRRRYVIGLDCHVYCGSIKSNAGHYDCNKILFFVVTLANLKSRSFYDLFDFVN